MSGEEKALRVRCRVPSIPEVEPELRPDSNWNPVTTNSHASGKRCLR